MRTAIALVSALALTLSLPAATSAQGVASGRAQKPAAADTATVSATRPTVVAYLVIPAGAVDTSAELAVLADDWNVAMATLGDSLQARGIRFMLVTEPRLRIRGPGSGDVVLVLDGEPAAGYVFARPGMEPCLRRGAAEAGEVLRTARLLLARRPASEPSRRAACDTTRRRTR